MYHFNPCSLVAQDDRDFVLFCFLLLTYVHMWLKNYAYFRFKEDLNFIQESTVYLITKNIWDRDENSIQKTYVSILNLTSGSVLRLHKNPIPSSNHKEVLRGYYLYQSLKEMVQNVRNGYDRSILLCEKKNCGGNYFLLNC